MIIHRSTDDGSNWSYQNIENAYGADGPDIWVDQSPTSTYSGRVYVAYGRGIKVRYDSTNGTSWSGGVLITSSADNTDTLPPNHPELATAPWGTVLCTYPRDGAQFSNFDKYYRMVGIARSHNGGSTWDTTSLPAHIRWKSKSVSGFTAGPNGSIAFNPMTKHALLAWTNWGVPGGSYDSTNPDIYAYRSPDSGRTWFYLGRINSVTTNSQFMPTLVCDKTNGYYACLFYDDRTTSGVFHAYIAVSLDNGSTWKEEKLSTNAYTSPEVPSHDYLALHSDSNYFYPIWLSGDSSSFQTQTRPFTIDCCVGMRGNADGDATESIDISDLTAIIGYVNYGDAILCPEEGDVNNSGSITTADQTYLTNYLFSAGPAPANCP